MREIAADAGFSIGALYQRFESKDALYGDVVEQHFGRIWAALDAALESHTEFVPRLMAAGHTVTGYQVTTTLAGDAPGPGCTAQPTETACMLSGIGGTVTISLRAIGMGSDEMLQHVGQVRGARAVAVGSRMHDVVDDHAFDHALTVGGLDQVGSEFGGDHRRDMLMLGNGQYLRLGQAAKSDAVFQ